MVTNSNPTKLKINPPFYNVEFLIYSISFSVISFLNSPYSKTVIYN